MPRLRWLKILSIAALSLAGCRGVPTTKKPDSTKGRVTGIVFCADTGKPARFANVTLSVYPKKDDKPDNDEALPVTERALTGLDGRFNIEAVEPGHYFAFATLEGYLDPKASIDLNRLGDKATGQERILDAIEQWKEHLVEVTVNVSVTADVTLQVERGAEIAGTVTYDDGSPAIGVWPQLFRKNAKNAWIESGITKGSTLSTASDGHGRYSLTNLPAGNYIVCVLLPAESDDLAPRICFPNVYRRKDATTVKAHPGEVANSVDITIPLSGLQTVTGQITVLPSGHALEHATVRLLYADDREPARETKSLDDGGFSFPYVPEGKYIVQVTNAGDEEKKTIEANPDGSAPKVTVLSPARHYADKEIPITVEDEMDDLEITLAPVAPAQPPTP